MRASYRMLYRAGLTPWDSPAIPAPVVAETRTLQPGAAVDLGCGTGHQARYLAAHGWSVTGVDYLAEVIAKARRLDPAGTVTWRAADVTDPAAVDPGGYLAGRVTLLLDNGCLHGISGRRRDGWARTGRAGRPGVRTAAASRPARPS